MKNISANNLTFLNFAHWLRLAMMVFYRLGGHLVIKGCIPESIIYMLFYLIVFQCQLALNGCLWPYTYIIYIYINIYTLVSIWIGSKPLIKVVLKPKTKMPSCLWTTYELFWSTSNVDYYILNKKINLYLWWQSWIFSIITPVFSVTWSIRNHFNMLIWCTKIYFFNKVFIWKP